jgi:tetratricopeptide (TPR) repeat protein
MLTQLIAKSWMLREEWNGQRRYRLLEPVRQFAQIQLAASGMEDRVRRRHAEYFLTLAEQMHQAWDTANEGEWLDRLEPERDNLRAVNAWAISHGERRFALQFNGWLFALWIYRSTMTESNYWLEAAIAIPRHGDLPMQADELEAEVVALDTAGYAALSRSNFAQAQQWFERALELRRGGDNLAGLSRALRGCGWTAMQKGDVARARQYDDEALEVARASGDPGEIAWSLLDVGYIMMLQGELTAAQATLGQACEQMLAAGISFGAFHATIALGHVMRGLNDLERAESMYHDALRLQQRMHYVQLTSHVLEGLAGIAAVRGNPARAIRLFSAAQAHRENYALPRWTHLDEICARDMALARSQIAPAQIEVAWQEGVALTLDQAVAYALE